MTRYAVIGGGMLGMSVALRLAAPGREVTLYERADVLGGLAAPWEIAGVQWDRHYHVILESDTHLLELLRTLELESSLNWKAATSAFFVNGAMHPFTSAQDFVRFPVLGILDKCRLVLTIAYALLQRNIDRLEDQTAESWLRRISGKRVFESLWGPLMRAKFGDAYTQTSAAFMLSTIVRLYGGSGRKGGKRFGYVGGGYGAIVDRLRRQLDRESVQVRLRTDIDSIDALSDGTLAINVSGEQRLYDCVVVTTPAPVAARLCKGLQSAERSRLCAIRHQGIICASMLLDEPLGAAYITNIADPSIPFTGVIEMTRLIEPSEIGGATLVYLPLYVDAQSPYFAWSDEKLRVSFSAALQRMYPRFRPSAIRGFRVSRVPHVFALPVLGYSQLVPPMHTSIPGLFIANATHITNGTLNVNETLDIGRRVVSAVEDAGITGARYEAVR